MALIRRTEGAVEQRRRATVADIAALLGGKAEWADPPAHRDGDGETPMITITGGPLPIDDDPEGDDAV